jgi:hypothetical protein
MNNEPTFYSEGARQRWLKREAERQKAEQLAKERADRAQVISDNSATAANQQIAQENYMRLLAEFEKQGRKYSKLTPASSTYIGARRV